MAISEDLTQVLVFGPVVVTIDGSTVGHTSGDGVEFNYEPSWTDVKVDEYGETLVDRVLIGERAMAKFILAQFDPEVMNQALVAGSFGATNPPLQVGSTIGAKASDSAVELVLRPRVNGATEDDDITVYKAFPSSGFTIPLKYAEQAALATEFEALIDSSKDDGNRLFGIGDQTV